MKALTPAEVRELEDGMLPAEVWAGDVTEDNWPIIQDLAKRQLLVVHDFGEYIAETTTERGKLALRVHAAYLASLSG